MDIDQLIAEVNVRKEELSGTSIQFSDDIRFDDLKTNLTNALNDGVETIDKIASFILSNQDYFQKITDEKVRFLKDKCPFNHNTVKVWFRPVFPHKCHYVYDESKLVFIHPPMYAFTKKHGRFILDKDIFLEISYSESLSNDMLIFEISDWKISITKEHHIWRGEISDLLEKMTNYVPKYEQMENQIFWEQMKSLSIICVESIEMLKKSFQKMLKQMLQDIEYTICIKPKSSNESLGFIDELLVWMNKS